MFWLDARCLLPPSPTLLDITSPDNTPFPSCHASLGARRSEERGLWTTLSSLFGGEGRPEPQKEKHAAPPDDLGFDPALLARVAGIMRSQGEKREERALLDAMRPYLSPRRREKMDRAVRLARIASIASVALGALGKEGRDEQV